MPKLRGITSRIHYRANLRVTKDNISRDVCTVGHKSHDPCFHTFIMGARGHDFCGPLYSTPHHQIRQATTSTKPSPMHSQNYAFFFQFSIRIRNKIELRPQVLGLFFQAQTFMVGGHSIAPKTISAKRRKRQSVTAKQEKSQTPKFVQVRLSYVRLSQVRLGKVSIAVETFGVCDFSCLAVTDWRLRRWRLWFLALLTATLMADLLKITTYFY